MLNSSLLPFKSTKINECIMRRRARNLRAKVKALLPVQICCKHDHRNRCVHEIQNNKRIWESYSKKKKWAIGQEKQNQYYFQNQAVIDHHQRFQKLTDSQIEQIKEDRLYYLGEENLNDFQEFIKNRSKITIDQPTIELLGKAFQNFCGKRYPSFQYKPCESNYQSQIIHTEASLLQPNEQIPKLKKKVTVDEKLREFEERRKVIEYQQKSKRLMNKVKMNMRLQRAEAKLQEIKTKKMSQLSTRKQQIQMSLEKLTNRRRNYHHQGQIKMIQQQLRRTFLNRKTKTAKQMSRTARTQTMKSSN